MQSYPRRNQGSVAAILLSIPLMIVVSAIARGIVLSILWRWFVVETFSSVSQLSVAQAVGLALAVGMFTGGQKNSEGNITFDADVDVTVAAVSIVLLAALGPFVTLFMGWIIHLFV